VSGVSVLGATAPESGVSTGDDDVLNTDVVGNPVDKNKKVMGTAVRLPTSAAT
jgi:hypothetical protein